MNNRVYLLISLAIVLTTVLQHVLSGAGITQFAIGLCTYFAGFLYLYHNHPTNVKFVGLSLGLSVFYGLLLQVNPAGPSISILVMLLLSALWERTFPVWLNNFLLSLGFFNIYALTLILEGYSVSFDVALTFILLNAILCWAFVSALIVIFPVKGYKYKYD